MTASDMVREGIHWVGYVDWNVRDFHGYHTGRGSTYNAYLIEDAKTALIDTVKGPYATDLLRRVARYVDPAKIDYVVCNHAEADHSGALGRVLEVCPRAQLVCNEKCRDTLSRHYDTSGWKFRVVTDGEELALGRRTLRFIDTPMVHWPESMFTYVPEEKLLFSMDAFGQHYASSARFDDEVSLETLLGEAKTYWANIVMPYAKQVSAVLEKAAALDIETIAPSHGLIWRKNLGAILSAYKDWAASRPAAKVLIAYDTMWGSTDRMARAIAEGAIEQSGAETRLYSIRSSNITVLATEILDAAAVALGTPTLNRTMMPEMGALLTYFKGLRPQNKAGFAFGSYGWAKGGAQEVDTVLREMKFEILREPLQARYVPDAAILEECRQAGAMLAQKAAEMARSFSF